MNPVVSIIIPAYNSGTYIKRCVESVLAQTFKSIEIIIIDDGSEKNSNEIYKCVAQWDERIFLYEQNNLGAAVARNSGLVRAKGEYVVFLDSDDYWNDDKFLEDAINQIKKTNCDIMLFEFIRNHNQKFEKTQKQLDVEKIRGKMDANKLNYIMANVYNIISPCSKIIKRELMVENDIYFPEGRLHEDIDWAMSLMSVCGTVDILNKAPYIRTIRENSASKKRTYKDCDDLLWVLEKWTARNDIDQNIKMAFYGQLCFQLFITMGMCDSIADPKQRSQLLKRIKQYYWLRKYPNNKKTRTAAALTRVFPFFICCKIFGAYINR